MTLRKYTHELLHTHVNETKTQHTIRLVIASLIVFSIFSVMLETVDSIYRGNEEIFYALEFIIIVVFSIEYLLRIWSCVEEERYARPILGRLKYMFSPMSLIDLAAIMPFYIPWMIRSDLRVLRGLRLIRLMRVLKLGEYTKGIHLVSTVVQKKRHDIIVTFFLIFILLIVSSSVMFFIEHDAQPTQFSSIPASLWWGICTLTTMGYVDMQPVTLAGRFFTAVILLLGISSFALPTGIIVSGLLDEMDKHKIVGRQMVYCPYCKERLPHVPYEEVA